MRQGRLLCLLLIFTANSSVQATTDQTPTVDRLTCSQAIAFVQKFQRYYVATVDGAIPMYPITPIGKNQELKAKDALSFHVVKTHDQARCLIGFTARNAN